MQISSGNKFITNIYNTKFLGFMINNSKKKKNHTDEPISKLNKLCHAIRAVNPLMSPEVLRMIYFSYCHSIISYSTNFWGNLLIVKKKTSEFL
jgi:hypothetical protein